MKYIITSLIVFISSCNSAALDGIEKMKNYDFKNPIQFNITSKLNEISDLTIAKDGNLFAINDEMGIIYKINENDGKILKRFFLGRWSAEGDFEGLATAGDYIFAITSEGTLYKFKEGKNEEAVEYDVIKLPFSSKFDIEGLYYDRELDGLLIVPKDYAGKNFKNHRAIYFYSLESQKINKKPLITISLKVLKEKFNVKDFYPSGITKHPQNGNYYIISAKGDNVIIEISKTGSVLSVKKLKEKIHRQPEGIEIMDDYSLIISDEASGKKPTLTVYKYQEEK